MQKLAMGGGLHLIGGHQLFLGNGPQHLQLHGIGEQLHILLFAAAGAFCHHEPALLKDLDQHSQLSLQLQLPGVADLGVTAQHLQPELGDAVLPAAGRLDLLRERYAAPDTLPAVRLLLLAQGLDLHYALDDHRVLPDGLLLDLALGGGGQDAVNVGLGVRHDDLGGHLPLLLGLVQQCILVIVVLDEFHACSPSLWAFVSWLCQGGKKYEKRGPKGPLFTAETSYL